MQPDPTNLLERIGLSLPLVGFYDAPDASPFEPLVEPEALECVFAFYENWLREETLHITKDKYGCRGCGNWLCHEQSRSREDLVKFLVNGEGLKVSHDLMNQWLDTRNPYMQEYPHILIGPLREEQYEYCKTITFFVNPDQLSMLIIGANYNNSPDDPPAVIAPFGAGCMEMVPLFDDLRIP